MAESAEKQKINLTIPGLTIINGLQGGGKSHLIRTIMHQYRKKFDWGVVFSETGWRGGNFDYIPDKYVHHEYSERVLEGLLNLQKRLISDGKSPIAFVIFDDCIEEKEWQKKSFRSMLTQLRHYNIFAILSVQHPYFVPNKIRAQAFQVAMFEMDNERALKALYESYGQRFASFAAFKEFVFGNTGDYQFILFDKSSKSRDINEKFKVLKAPEKIPKFLIKYGNK